MGAEASAGYPEKGMGRLFALEKGSLKEVDQAELSNGLAWNADDTIMYFIDSTPRVVYAYDFDSSNGTLGN